MRTACARKYVTTAGVPAKNLLAFAAKAIAFSAVLAVGIGSVASAATIHRIDMERSDGGFSITQAGWTSSAVPNGAPTTTTTMPTPAGVTVTAGGGGYFQGRAGGTWGPVNVTDADWDDLVGDTAAARGGDGTVIIDFTGLAAVEHTLTSWHNVSATDSQSFSSGLYSITPSVTTGTLVGAATVGAASNVDKNATATMADFNNSVISFMPDGSGNASIVLTSASANQFLTLSAIELVSVPEPTTVVLLGLGISIAVVVSRRRK